MGAVFAEELSTCASRRSVSSRSARSLRRSNQLTLEAHCSPGADLRFEGHPEKRTLLETAVDVVVCDGFTKTSR